MTLPPIETMNAASQLVRLAELQKQRRAIDDEIYEIRRLIASIAPGRTKTEYVERGGIRAKVVHPGKRYEQSGLKAIWHECPSYGGKFVRISQFKPNLREVDKLMRMDTDDEELSRIQDELRKAEREPWAPAQVVIVDGKG